MAQLEDPREIRHRAGYITLGMTIIVKKGAEKMDESFEFKMRNNLNSLLSHSSGTPLHFVIITDRNSLSSAAESLGSILGQHVADKRYDGGGGGLLSAHYFDFKNGVRSTTVRLAKSPFHIMVKLRGIA